MSNRPTLKVLLVEDNPVNQKVTLYQLKSLGYSVDAVSDGQSAINQITATAYDIVLLNCQMTGLSGYETTQAIRQLEQQNGSYDRQSRMVIIAMNNDLSTSIQAQGQTVGIDDYLNKPIRKEELALKLEFWSQQLALDIDSMNEGSKQSSPTEPATVDLETIDELIDWNHLHQMSDDNEEFELELLKIFIDDTRQHLGAAKAAISAADLWKLEQEAHHMKGASANVGVKAMQSAAAQLEQQARQKQLDGASELVAEIEAPLPKIQAFINKKV